MAPGNDPPGLDLGWGDQALELRIRVGPSGRVWLAHLTASPAPDGETPDDGPLPTLPLADIVTAGSGRSLSGQRYAHSVVGSRLRYTAHQERSSGPWRELKLLLDDATSGLRTEVTYKVLAHVGVLRSSTRLVNTGSSAVTVESATSFLSPGLAGPGGELADLDVMWADNDWLGEGRWQSRPFRDALPDLMGNPYNHDPRAMFGFTGQGSWSSGAHLPMGAAVNRRTGHAWVWQIEHNGAWHWQVGEHITEREGSAGLHEGRRDAYLALLGPTYAEHDWRVVLAPGETFETVPVALAVAAEGLGDAIARITKYRRSIQRPHDDHRRLPVIFNDYMNTLMGEPTTDRLAPLISAAGRAGAEYFCIDAGWYAELGEAWWDRVGEWAPSASRFPGGIGEVLDMIRAQGMVPGLWVEPEVVGVHSPVAKTLPGGAFFSRAGRRVVEHGRYQLDFSHPAARQHLDRVVDFLVEDLGVGYLKMDYNINIGPGTEKDSVSAGAGLLAHNRAFLDWARGLLDRHKGLTIESCASGGMRTDYATLSHFQLHSTSDQQDFLRYTPIAVAAPMAVAPEQGAVWAYPQPGWRDNEISFALCNALLGRVHLSGHLDQMTVSEQQLVAEAISTYKLIRQDLAVAVPFWPLGLPRWTDHWLALGMSAPGVTYVVTWRRGGQGRTSTQDDALPASVHLPVARLKGTGPVATVLYPSSGGTGAEWHAGTAELEVTLPGSPSACLVELRNR